VVCVVALGLLGPGPAGADEASNRARRAAAVAGAPRASALEPRVLVGTPWGKDDTTGDAFRSRGDLRRIIVGNGRQQMDFTFRTVAYPRWDTPSTDRFTFMVFDMDWRGTSAAPNRTLVVDRVDNVWEATILNGRGQVVCSRTGGVRQLTNNRFNITAPVQLCLGGAHVLRVASVFVDDVDDTDVEVLKRDFTPNSRFYGPFIRLPGTRSEAGVGAGGWIVH